MKKYIFPFNYLQYYIYIYIYTFVDFSFPDNEENPNNCQNRRKKCNLFTSAASVPKEGPSSPFFTQKFLLHVDRIKVMSEDE
jgi:hypothetical protein